MRYSQLTDIYERLEGTAKNLEKRAVVTEFLKNKKPEEIEHLMLLLEGRIFTKESEKEIGIADKLIVKALKNASGLGENELMGLWKKTGDLGLTAEKALTTKKQATLKTIDITVDMIINNLRECAEIQGKGAVEKKLYKITELLINAKPKEAKYIIRTILSTLRIGIGFGIIRDAIAHAYNVTSEEVQDAYDLTNDLGMIARIILEKGANGLKRIRMKIGNPINVMLFEKADDVKNGFEIVGRPCAVEIKYDGMRLQIHKNGKKIILYTRRLENVTEQFPEIIKPLMDNIKMTDGIMEGELVAYNPRTRRYLAFQDLSRRIKRKYDIQEISEKMPAVLYLFDLLNYEGNNYISKPFMERRAALDRIVKVDKWKVELATQIITGDEKEAQDFFNKAISLAEEGIMMKNLSAEYKPGRRVGYGVKVKTIKETLDLAITGAVWGKGKRGKWLSSFIIACEDNGELKTIGKIASGLTEQQFDEITKKLKPRIIEEKGREVKVKPEIILEVGYEEIQSSPTYTSGYALRFPRLMRIREDLNRPNELEKVKRIYKETRK